MNPTRWISAAALLALGTWAGGCKEQKTKLVGTSAPSSQAISGPTAAGMKFLGPVANAEWTLPAGDLANTRFSALAQITPENVKGLKVVSSVATGVARGHEGNPLVVGDTMYLVTPYPNDLIALDLTRPGTPMRWKYRPHPDPRSVGIACCDVVNRGASYADGKIIYNLLDAHTVAVDAKTGKEVWRTQVGDIALGETFTMAPLVVKNLVLTGNSGGELGVRGKLVALDLATGKEVWRGYNNGPDADVLIGPDYKSFYPKDRGKDLGVSSWPPDAWKIGGGTVWGWISYDPELDLIFYGTGNPGPWNPDLRPGTNHFTCAIVARRPNDGAVKWAFQISPHDAWDYDEIMENVLVDMDWKGKPRKLLIHPGRSGFMFVLDRETGELLSAEAFEPTNWASGFDLQTGLPIENSEKRTHQGKTVHDICPSSTGAKEFVPTALSPRTGLLYVPGHNTCMKYEAMEANYIAGTPYLGAEVTMYPGPGGYQGELFAWDVANAKKVWSVKEEKFPVMSGVLATAGDVVFYGTMDGWFKALDAKNGTELWRYKLPSGVVGNPITYLGPDGKQYVAIYSAVGGWMGAVAFDDISYDDPTAALGVVGAMRELKHYTGAGDALFIFGL